MYVNRTKYSVQAGVVANIAGTHNPSAQPSPTLRPTPLTISPLPVEGGGAEGQTDP